MATSQALKKSGVSSRGTMKLITSKEMFNDNWQNLMTNIGIAATDKKVNTNFVQSQDLTRSEIIDLYRGEGIAKKIIDIPAQDMVREWIKVTADTKDSVLRAMDQLKARQAMRSAIKWARLYGGSMILMGINDGTKGKATDVLQKPLREDNIKSFEFLQVYNRTEVHWNGTDIDMDAKSRNFGQPLFYTIFPADNTGVFFKVHHSRVLRFIGEELPNRESRARQGWGDSVLQSTYIRLRGFGEAMISTESILEEFVMGVMTIKNLQDLVSTPGQEDALQKRLQQIDQAKHILNTILVDVEEEFTRMSANVNGIKDLLEFLKAVISAVAEIPQVKLFGEQSKGIGAGAVGNIRLYYDGISDRQDSDLRPHLERIISLLIKSDNFTGEVGENWRLEFNPLWKLTAQEIAAMRLDVAKSDDIYLKNAVITPKEVADSRFGGETYSQETKLGTEDGAARKGLKMSPEAGLQRPNVTDPGSSNKPGEFPQKQPNPSQ